MVALSAGTVTIASFGGRNFRTFDGLTPKIALKMSELVHVLVAFGTLVMSTVPSQLPSASRPNGGSSFAEGVGDGRGYNRACCSAVIEDRVDQDLRGIARAAFFIGDVNPRPRRRGSCGTAADHTSEMDRRAG